MKKILVTGASGGIGSAIVKKLSEEGYFVLAQYRSSMPPESETVIPVYGDLSTVEGVRAFCASVKAFGRLFGLVNCAGISLEKPFDVCTEEEISDTVFTDLTSAMLVTRSFVPDFVGERRGVIVNISSVWGRVGASCEVAYSAAKGGLITFTKALAKELGPSCVRVNCVCPGFIDTKMNSRYTEAERQAFFDGVALGRSGTPDEVAAAVSFLLSDSASYITGAVLDADGGI